MQVVDLCCGDGYFTAPLARIVEGKLYGVEWHAQCVIDV
jgi:protein-L-isoaspartate O-methyltransferase